MDQQQEEEDATVALDSDNPVAEEAVAEDGFVHALEDEVNIDTSTLAHTLNTDDESSSANVDRMDLADAYDEELADEEVDEKPTPVLAMGGNIDDDLDNQHSSDNGYVSSPQEIAPGGADDDAVEAPKDTFITEEMEKELRALQWRKGDIRRMRPDVAAVVLHKQLQRPREGMPASFYKEGMVPANDRKVGKVLKTLLVPACCAAAVICSGGEVNWAECGNCLKSLPRKIGILPKGTVEILAETTATPTELSLIHI